MPRRAKTARVALCMLAAVLASGVAAPTNQAVADAGDGQGPDRSYHTVVSAPDFLNADVGDVSRLSSWDGEHNSFNPSYRRALDVVLDAFAAARPDSMLVAGDLVEGHWGIDTDRTGIFGPVDTYRQRLAAVRRAGRFYYGTWKRMFAAHSLPLPHVSVGDHEIGDDPWPVGRFKHSAVGIYKDTFADALIGSRYASSRRPMGTPYARTSYWKELHPEIMLVSVDVFRHARRREGSTGGVVADLEGEHLAWFRRVLAHGRANYDWVIVQAHTPILGPVRIGGSSGIFLEGGRRSAMWRAMRDYDVDVYLAGEVHAVTAIEPARGPVQITHGGLFAWGRANYLRMDFSKDRIRLQTHDFDFTASSTTRLWQTSRKRPPELISYEPDPPVSGTAILTHEGRLIERTGDLAPADLERQGASHE